MYAPMLYRKARGGDLGNILVWGRNYMRRHVRDRKQIAASVAASVWLGPMQALVRLVTPYSPGGSIEVHFAIGKVPQD